MEKKKRGPPKGTRPSGRQKGTPNKATVEKRKRIEAGVKASIESGIMPIDVMLARMRGEPLPTGQIPTDAQFQAAIAAAPYIHARLSSETHKVTNFDGDRAEADLKRELDELERLEKTAADPARTVAPPVPPRPPGVVH